METPQLLLIVVIIILTIILLVVGIQAFLTLRDFRKTVKKANFLLDGVESGTNIVKIVGTAVALFAGNKLGRNFMDLISIKKDESSDKNGKVIKSNLKTNELIEINVGKPKKEVKRFFRRTRSL